MDWHCDGFGFGEIARALLLGELGDIEDGDEVIGVTPQEILDMKASGMGWGQIKKQFNVHPSQLAPGQVISGKVRFVDTDDNNNGDVGEGDVTDDVEVMPLQTQSEDSSQRVPPGQAKKSGNDGGQRVPPGQAKKSGDGDQWTPPGQAKKDNPGNQGNPGRGNSGNPGKGNSGNPGRGNSGNPGKGRGK